QMIRARAAAEAVPEVRRTGEAGAPHPAVLADLLQRLDDQRILADTLGDRWRFARLDEGRDLRCLAEALGERGGVGEDLRTFQLADPAAFAGPLRNAPRA